MYLLLPQLVARDQPGVGDAVAHHFATAHTWDRVLHARVRRVVFGARDPKTGAAGGVVDLFGQRQLNHQTAIVGGVLEGACGQLLRDFFAERRALQKLAQQAARAEAESADPALAATPAAIPAGDATEVTDWPDEAFDAPPPAAQAPGARPDPAPSPTS